MDTDQKNIQNLRLFQKMRLEILGGPFGIKFRIQGHLWVGKGEKHPLGQNCPKADATIKLESGIIFKSEMLYPITAF